MAIVLGRGLMVGTMIAQPERLWIRGVVCLVSIVKLGSLRQREECWEARSSCSLSDSDNGKSGALQEVLGEPRALGELGTKAPVLNRGESSASDTKRSVAHWKSVGAECVSTREAGSAERLVPTVSKMQTDSTVLQCLAYCRQYQC